MPSNSHSTSFVTALSRQLRLSATLEINELVQKKTNQGHRIVHLGFGEATFPIPSQVANAHREASLMTSYLPVAGLIKLREAIARFQSRRLGSVVHPEQVVVAPGSKPLLFALFDVLEGDVLLPRPSWVSYEPQIRHAGKQLFWVETSEQNRHTITGLFLFSKNVHILIQLVAQSLRDSFDKALTGGGNPRIMLVNSPSNPTGQVYTKEVVEMIAMFCKNNNITLISDEIYSDIDFTGGPSLSVGADSRLNDARIVLTGGLSKTYSAGGWRVGYAIFPTNEFGKTVQSAILAYASECWSAASAPAQEAAAIAFDTSPEMNLYRTQVVALHKWCTLALFRTLSECGLDIPEPEGAFYLYPSFRPYSRQLESLEIRTSIQLSHWLIKDCGIAALPGAAFGEDDNGLAGGQYRVRMSTSCLYFKNHTERYEKGHELLASAVSNGDTPDLPLLNGAIETIQDAIRRLKEVSLE